MIKSDKSAACLLYLDRLRRHNLTTLFYQKHPVILGMEKFIDVEKRHGPKRFDDGWMRELEKTPKADLHASFAAIRLQRASLRETANRDDSGEAKDAGNSVLKFAKMLEETGLLDYVVKLRNETCERMSGSSAAGSGVYPARLFGEQNSHQNSHHLPLKHPKMV